MNILVSLSNFVSKYMALIAIIVAVETFFYPPSFHWVIHYIPLLLGIVMFGMGLTLRLEDFKMVAKRPKDVLIGALAQFTIMPGLAWILATLFHLPPELAVGVILVGTCPGGTSSNVMTYLAKGDVALSVSMTLCTTIVAPIITPLLTLWLAGQWVDINAVGMFLSIVKIVIVPIVLGIIVNGLFRKRVEAVVQVLPLVSIIAIVLIIGGVVSIDAGKILSSGLLILLVVILHNLLGYAAGFAIAKILRLDMKKAKAISIEVGMQNSGLATTLAMAHFNPIAAIPAVIFSVWHNISGSIAANYLSARAKRQGGLEE